MTPTEILDACTHGRAPLHDINISANKVRHCPCRPCAEAAIAAAVLEERNRVLKLVSDAHDGLEGWRLERDEASFLRALDVLSQHIRDGQSTGLFAKDGP